MRDLTPDQLDAAARAWLVQSQLYPRSSVVDTCHDLSLATDIPKLDIQANMAAITERAGQLRVEIAKRNKQIASRVAAAKKGARTRGRLRDQRESRGG